jgi:diaminohydroxyphosphoribosylaminopyrimidine deaminase/5-amino-6-(5-phosphoribosylamino)uracil reductase
VVTDADRDRRLMARALFLAERGRGRTMPNPMVGAVVVASDGVIAGQGAHLRAGEAHAEVHALSAAGARARGGTLYCTLEPCCHVGRTGPCVERIAEAGITRVVAAMRDPHPHVSGGGFAYLRSRGIEVSEGVLAESAAALNAPFVTWVEQRRPHVTLKLAVSRDGFVGDGHRRVTLTCATTDRRMHRQRAEVDAIAAGAETMLVDDPQLTARGCYRYRPLLRVVFDWRLRVPAGARVFSTLAAGPVIMIVTAKAASERAPHVAMLLAMGVDVEVFDAPDVRAALTALAARDVLSLLIEGGPRLQTAYLEAGLVDVVQWIAVPRMLHRGVAAWDPARFGLTAPARTMPLGDDLLMEFDVHRPH